MARRTPKLWLSLCLAIVLAGCGSRQAQDASPSTRVLFIGNSYTYYNGGLDNELEGLAPTVTAESFAKAGYSLQDHWNDAQAISTIQDGQWDYVVVQEQSQRPVTDQAGFYEFGRDLDVLVRDSGAQTVLMMTWERPDSVSFGVTSMNLAIAYDQLGKELGAKVAPVGLAFASSRILRPDLVLYSADGHPSVLGTYLAACVIYRAVLGETPLGNPYISQGMTARDAAYLQQVAADTLGS